MIPGLLKENLADGSVIYRHPTLPFSCKVGIPCGGETVIEFFSGGIKIGEWDGFFFTLEEDIFLTFEAMNFCFEMIQKEVNGCQQTW